MLVCGVLVVKFVLNQIGEPAKFGDVFAQEADFMHHSQNTAHTSAVIEDFQEGCADMWIVQEFAVDQRQFVADELGEFRFEGESTLLGEEEEAHQALRGFVEHSGRGSAYAPVLDSEAVHEGGGTATPEARQGKQLAGGVGGQCESLFHCAGDEVHLAGVIVIFAHEVFDADPCGALLEAQVPGDGWLIMFGEDVLWSGALVVQLGADSQQVIIGRFEVPRFCRVHHFCFDELLQVADSVFEKCHPEKVLVIAQSATSIFDVGLLHDG